MTQTVISVPAIFSRFPAGRVRTDGDFSGQRFREDFLVPALANDGETIVDLDGAAGYGSSFLEEAFGGLVRSNNFGESALREKLRLSTQDKSLEIEIWSYIHDEATRLGRP